MAGGGASPAQLSFPEGEGRGPAPGERAPRRSHAGPVASSPSGLQATGTEGASGGTHRGPTTPRPCDRATAAAENSRPRGRGLGAGVAVGAGVSSREQRPLQGGWGITTGRSRCRGSRANSDPCRVAEESQRPWRLTKYQASFRASVEVLTRTGASWAVILSQSISVSVTATHGQKFLRKAWTKSSLKRNRTDTIESLGRISCFGSGVLWLG